MSRTLLIECTPRRPADGSDVTARLAHKVLGPANHLAVQWEPVIVAPPSLESSIGFDGQQFAAAPTPQVGELSFALNARTRSLAGLVWSKAAVMIKMALWGAGSTRPADGAFTTVWSGFASDIAASDAQGKVKLFDAGEPLRRPLVLTKWGSSGVTLLDSADATKDRAADAIVPMAWGRNLSLPGTLVDRTYGIWLFAGRPATAVAGIYDGGAAFTLGVARASLAALQANVPARGAVDYCLDAGGLFLARPWTPPNFPITADATFGATKAADIAAAIVASRTGPAFTTGTVAALNALQAGDCGLYIDDESTTAAALDRLLAGIGVIWRLNSAGTIDLIRLAWGTPVLKVPAHRRGAPSRLSTVLPTAKRAIGYARNNRVHAESEIAGIILAGDVAYSDGTPVDALKPAESGATTGDNLQVNSSLIVDQTGYNNAGLAFARVAGINNPPAAWVLETTAAGTGSGDWQWPVSPILGGRKVWITVPVMRTGALTALALKADEFDALTGGGIGPVGGAIQIVPAAANVWQYFTVSGITSGNAGSMKVAAGVMSGNAGRVQIGPLRIGYTAPAADVTADQPIVSRLTPTSGQATDSFVASDGNSYARIVASGEARDGDTITFTTTLPGVPKVFFLPGGNAASAGQNIAITAVGLTTSGFTMKAKSQTVTVGSVITDSSSAAGSGGEPARVINRTNSGAPFDGKFIYRFPVTVGLVGGVDPGQIEVAAYAKIGGSWVEVARGSYAASGTYELTATPGTVDFGAGNEFGLAAVYVEGSGTSLTGFTSVKYSLGTVVETSLTPSGASSIPWQAFL